MPTAVRIAPLEAVLSVPPVTTVPLLRLIRPPLIADRVPPALFNALLSRFRVPLLACSVPVLVEPRPPDEMVSVEAFVTSTVSALLIVRIVVVPVRCVIRRTTAPPTLIVTSSPAPGSVGLLLQFVATSQNPSASGAQVIAAPRLPPGKTAIANDVAMIALRAVSACKFIAFMDVPLPRAELREKRRMVRAGQTAGFGSQGACTHARRAEGH